MENAKILAAYGIVIPQDATSFHVTDKKIFFVIGKTGLFEIFNLPEQAKCKFGSFGYELEAV